MVNFTSPPGEHPFKQELIKMIGWYDANTARSLQKTVGVSELGIKCQRRLAYRLAGTPAVNHPDPWFAVIGSAVHDWLAYSLDVYQTVALNRTGANRRFLIEKKVRLTDDHLGIGGSTDLFDVDFLRVVDHKVVGNDALKRYIQEGPSPEYRVQAHGYGYGWELLGWPVREVCLVFYPRSNFLSNMHVWTEPYDRQVALDALARVRTIDLARRHGVSPTDWPAAPDKGWCTWCPQYNPALDRADEGGCPGPLTSR